jgi:hypothetical protein
VIIFIYRILFSGFEGALPELTEVKPGFKTTPHFLKKTPRILPHPFYPFLNPNSSKQAGFFLRKTSGNLYKPQNRNFCKNTPKTCLTGRSSIAPDSHFLGHEIDRVTSCDQYETPKTSSPESSALP